MKEELKQVDNDIKDLEERLEILKRRKKAIESKINCPDLEGKYIKIKEGYTLKYIKVGKINKLMDGRDVVSGFTISVTILAIKTIYKIESESLTYLSSEYKIITEEEFNNELIDVIGNLYDKVDTTLPSLLKPIPEIKPWEAPDNKTAVIYGCSMPTAINSVNEARLMKSSDTATNNITCK